MGYGYVESGKDKAVCVTKAPITAGQLLGIGGHLLAKEHPKMPFNMLLHTRSATQGRPENNGNNHPIYSKKSGFCMIHNGWLINDEETKEKFGLKTDAEVDTEIYLKLIEQYYFGSAKRDVPTAVGLATQEVWGNFSCAMIQGGNPSKLWVWRTQGDLELVRTDLGYVFCSSLKHICNALYQSTSSAEVTFIEWLDLKNNMLAEVDSSGDLKAIMLSPPPWESLPPECKGAVTQQTWYSGGVNSTKWTRKSGYSRPGVGHNLPMVIDNKSNKKTAEEYVAVELGMKNAEKQKWGLVGYDLSEYD